MKRLVRSIFVRTMNSMFPLFMAAFLCYSQTITPQEKLLMDKVIHLSIVLRCDVHSAYQMFTENKLLESWLTSVAEVEPRFGGKYELFWQPDDRENNSTIGCKITALQPDKFISFEWKSPKQFKHFANNVDPLTHVVVFFIAFGDSTEVHLIHSGWRNSDQWEEARLWQEKAWENALNQLQQKINKK